MASDDTTDTRQENSSRKHRRSPDDEVEEPTKRRKHRHHHHHRSRHHRHRSRKHEEETKHDEETKLEEGSKQEADGINPPAASSALPPIRVVSGAQLGLDYEMEEGEIVEDAEEGFGGIVGDEFEKKDGGSDAKFGVIEPLEVQDGSITQNLGVCAEGGASYLEALQEVGPESSLPLEDSGGRNGRNSKASGKDNSDNDFVVVATLYRKDKMSHQFSHSGRFDDVVGSRNSGTKHYETHFNGDVPWESQNEYNPLKHSPSHDRTRDEVRSGSRSMSHDHARERSQSRSLLQEVNNLQHIYDDGDVERVAQGNRDRQQGSTDSARDEEKELGTSYGRGSERQKRDPSLETWDKHREARDMHRDRRREKERDRSTDKEKRADEERETSKDREKEQERSKDREKEQERSKEREKERERREREKEREKSREREREQESRFREKERERSRDRDVDRDRIRERERHKSRDRDIDLDRRWDKEREWSRDRDVDNYWRRESERDRSRDMFRERERDGEKGREKNRDRDRDNARERGRDSGRDRSRYAAEYRDSYNDYRYSEIEDHRDGVSRSKPGQFRSLKNDSLKEDEARRKRDEDEQEDYHERVSFQLEEQEEEDIDRIKEESRRRRQAILEKYKTQQLQQEVNPHLKNAVKDEETADQADQLRACSTALPENIDARNDGADVYTVDSSFSVGKSPTQNGVSAFEGSSGTAGLGEGSPKSERSNDMFCDDIFGDSPAGVRRMAKRDGLPIERSGLHDNWDDAEGYYGYRFGEKLDGRYEITAAHGKGVFSTVVRAKDLKAGNDDPEEVAIKIIRNNETMFKAGQSELTILKKLVGADPEDKRHCVRFLSSFKYRNHLCLVFESLHMNLREVLKRFGRNIGLKLTAVRAYAKQLFIALKHLRNCGVLHCDIKPDNMLVNEAKNVLKLCDFGNAMFAGKNEITPYLVSRFYRAPEIILGLPYDHPLDIWSVGCCLYELYTGKVLFPGPTNNDMLRLHMELKGPFPKKMLRKAAFIDQHFDQDLNFLATEEDPVTKKTIKRTIVITKPKDIGTIITGSLGEDPKMLANFKDLLDKIFVLDPDKRLTVSQALAHPFITGK